MSEWMNESMSEWVNGQTNRWTDRQTDREKERDRQADRQTWQAKIVSHTHREVSQWVSESVSKSMSARRRRCMNDRYTRHDEKTTACIECSVIPRRDDAVYASTDHDHGTTHDSSGCIDCSVIPLWDDDGGADTRVNDTITLDLISRVGYSVIPRRDDAVYASTKSTWYDDYANVSIGSSVIPLWDDQRCEWSSIHDSIDQRVHYCIERSVIPRRDDAVYASTNNVATYTANRCTACSVIPSRADAAIVVRFPFDAIAYVVNSSTVINSNIAVAKHCTDTVGGRFEQLLNRWVKLTTTRSLKSRVSVS